MTESIIDSQGLVFTPEPLNQAEINDLKWRIVHEHEAIPWNHAAKLLNHLAYLETLGFRTTKGGEL